MTLNVELNPKVTAGLLAQAEARGLSLEAYVSEVLKERSREAVAGEQSADGLLTGFVRSPPSIPRVIGGASGFRFAGHRRASTHSPVN
jgi:hypothetical protein